MAADPEPDHAHWRRRVRCMGEGQLELQEATPGTGKRHHGWRGVAALRDCSQRCGGALTAGGHQLFEPGPDQVDSPALCEQARKVRRKIENGPLAMDANTITLRIET